MCSPQGVDMSSEDVDLLDYEDQGDDEIDGCLHGIPWCEECPWCEDDVEDSLC